jgi:hypothetical protein
MVAAIAVLQTKAPRISLVRATGLEKTLIARAFEYETRAGLLWT